MITLSVKQPWAYLLCTGIKNIENRTWKLPEKFIGKRVLIHASGKPAMRGFYGVPFPDEFWNNLSDKGKDKLAGDIDVRSAIIGSVRFVDCVINHESIWAEKCDPLYSDKTGGIIEATYNWVVADPILFDKPILNIKGKLRFWSFGINSFGLRIKTMI